MAYLKDLLVTGPSRFIEDIHGNDIYANNFIGNLIGGFANGEALIGNAQGGITTRQILNNTGAQDIGWSDNNTSIKLINQNSIAYWNGAYNSGTGSNLRYFSDAYFNSNAFIPRTTGTYNLGTSSYKWNQIYLNSIQFRGSSYTTDNYITSNAQNNIFFSVGGINSLVVENTDLRPGSGRNITLGTSSNKWYGLYTNSLQVPNSGTITSSLPIKVTHASGGQKEFQIVYGDNIDFSLMVGTANSNHGLYDRKKGTDGTWILSADSTNHNWSFNGNASTATTTKALKTADITTGSDITSHADVIQQYFSANYSSTPREKLLSFYSNIKEAGSQYLGYFISNYNTSPYGSFITLHYNNNPKFIGINNGNYSERTILTDDGAGNFLPAATNTYNLGSSTYQWNALYMNKLQVPSTGVIQANLPIRINGGENYSNNIPGANASSLVIYKPDNDYPAIELYRHASSGTSAKASWQLINENGTFKIKENWNGTTENSTYTETLLAISSTNKLFTTYAPITANAPIKVIHAAGGQKEFEITYGSNIDFSLMVGQGNSNHGLYDSKIGSQGDWVLKADSTNHKWTLMVDSVQTGIINSPIRETVTTGMTSTRGNTYFSWAQLYKLNNLSLISGRTYIITVSMVINCYPTSSNSNYTPVNLFWSKIIPFYSSVSENKTFEYIRGLQAIECSYSEWDIKCQYDNTGAYLFIKYPDTNLHHYSIPGGGNLTVTALQIAQ